MYLGSAKAFSMKVRYILSIILVLIVILIVKTCHDAGAFKSLVPHTPGKTLEMYTSIPGTEDIDIDRDNGLLFISSTNRRENNSKTDGIYLLDLKKEGSTPRKLITTYSGDFHPHGISLYKQDSTLYLHAVNHKDNGDFIEMFEFRNNILIHLLSISSEQMCCPNDVVAVGKFMCYITNDHGYPSGIKRTLEDYLKIPKAYILYYNGNTFSKAFEGLNYANGIDISPDGSLLYATHTTGQEMLTFQIDKSSGEISLLDRKDLNTGVDNIDVDADGNIWIGCHPKLFDFVAHAKDSTQYSPSQVVRLIPGKEVHTEYHVDEIFLDDGKTISGSSVGLHYQGELFIGVVFDRKLMRINLD